MAGFRADAHQAGLLRIAERAGPTVRKIRSLESTLHMIEGSAPMQP
ncbi:hypothetical protein [Streptomyces sp. TRM75563]|nr:hypothetical protein [Streptomyces sp. TRM75563]MCI4046062.1 hypothetical protein [Streptomyces sp. TRM75563]